MQIELMDVPSCASVEKLRSFTLKVTRQLLDKYGLEKWRVVIDDRPSKNRLGQCRAGRKEIGVSRFMLEQIAGGLLRPDDLIETILHEVAHVLAPESNHHLPWKRQFVRLLWREFDGDECRVRSALRHDSYCWQRIDELVEFARANRRRRLSVVMPERKQGRARKFPQATRQLYVTEDTSIESFWIVSEGPKTYLCAELNDRCGQGKLRRFSKKVQGYHRDSNGCYRENAELSANTNLFHSLTDAQKQVLKRIEYQLKSHEELLRVVDSDTQKLVEHGIKEYQEKRQRLVQAMKETRGSVSEITQGSWPSDDD